MLTICSEPGCSTLVMGGRCLEHETVPAREFVRGRPLLATSSGDVTAHGAPVFALTAGAHTLVAGRDALVGSKPSRR
jgi:hypothetical protein